MESPSYHSTVFSDVVVYNDRDNQIYLDLESSEPSLWSFCTETEDGTDCTIEADLSFIRPSERLHREIEAKGVLEVLKRPIVAEAVKDPNSLPGDCLNYKSFFDSKRNIKYIREKDENLRPGDYYSFNYDTTVFRRGQTRKGTGMSDPRAIAAWRSLSAVLITWP